MKETFNPSAGSPAPSGQNHCLHSECRQRLQVYIKLLQPQRWGREGGVRGGDGRKEER